ncbi:MAG TPA: Xaa-Pro dipeptidase [Gammaproteobacteria bacterium]|nr:Xaa-Pro dipeptidase [Gammaproteobacteria bacterium]
MTDSLARHYPAHLAAVSKSFGTSLEATGFEQVAIFAGSHHVAFLDDYEYPFKVNPQFKYWLPLQHAHNSFIVFTPGKKPVLVYYQPDDYWYLPPQAPAGYWVEHFEIRIIKQPDDARAALGIAPKCAYVGEWQERFGDWGFAAVNPDALIQRLHYARAAKTEYEIECMRAANVRSAKAHRAAEKAFRAGASEFEIHTAFCQAAGQTDDELPYHAIIALNEHAATLHYQFWNTARPSQHHAFLIDAAAQVHGYAADVTRTWSAKADEFQALIDALDGEQQKLAANVRPGLDYAALHLEAHQVIARLLHDFDFVKLSPADIVARGISSAFFPHGLGHLLGLQVHDVGGRQAGPEGGEIPRPDGHPYLRTTRTLGENFAVTIEPGLYFIPSLLAKLKAGAQSPHINWPKVDEFRKYGGIRIEDNVVARTTGPENLTRDAFRKLHH